MNKRLICISCPTGCALDLEIENGQLIKVTGNKCPKGEAYAKQEIENPMRVLATLVLAKGLELKIVPVRTSGPIPKTKIFDAIHASRSFLLEKPVKAGDVLISNLLGLGVDLIATRECGFPPAK